MPSWVKDEGTWEKAKAKAKETYPDLSEDDDKFWKITTAIYKKMGGVVGKCILLFRRVMNH